MKNELTGKCKDDFRIWFDVNYNDYWTYYHTKPVILKALIIDFFQYRQIWQRIFYVEYRKTAFMNYGHAQNEAIIKANEIYNEKL